jgi:hypothetical protein
MITVLIEENGKYRTDEELFYEYNSIVMKKEYNLPFKSKPIEYIKYKKIEFLLMITIEHNFKILELKV